MSHSVVSRVYYGRLLNIIRGPWYHEWGSADILDANRSSGRYSRYLICPPSSLMPGGSDGILISGYICDQSFQNLPNVDGYVSLRQDSLSQCERWDSHLFSWWRSAVDAQVIIARPPHQPPVILSGTPEVGLAPLTCGCWPINSISANIGHRNSIRILNQHPFWWNILIWW